MRTLHLKSVEGASCLVDVEGGDALVVAPVPHQRSGEQSLHRLHGAVLGDPVVHRDRLGLGDAAPGHPRPPLADQCSTTGNATPEGHRGWTRSCRRPPLAAQGERQTDVLRRGRRAPEQVRGGPREPHRAVVATQRQLPQVERPVDRCGRPARQSPGLTSERVSRHSGVRRPAVSGPPLTLGARAPGAPARGRRRSSRPRRHRTQHGTPGARRPGCRRGR